LGEKTIDFMIRTKKATYAGKGAEAISSRPNSHDLEYIEGEFKCIIIYKKWFILYNRNYYRNSYRNDTFTSKN